MTGQIFINENERFQVDKTELTCGDAVKVLVYNGLTQKAEWISSTVEHNGYSYFLTGLLGYNPVGLFAQIG